MVFLVVALVQGVVFGFACRYLAREKGKDPQAWFWYGLLFGFIALLVLMASASAVRSAGSSGQGGATPVNSGEVLRATEIKPDSVTLNPSLLDLHRCH